MYSHSIWYRVVTGEMVEGKREKGGGGRRWRQGVELPGRGSGQRRDARRLRGGTVVRTSFVAPLQLRYPL